MKPTMQGTTSQISQTQMPLSEFNFFDILRLCNIQSLVKCRLHKNACSKEYSISYVYAAIFTCRIAKKFFLTLYHHIVD